MGVVYVMVGVVKTLRVHKRTHIFLPTSNSAPPPPSPQFQNRVYAHELANMLEPNASTDSIDKLYEELRSVIDNQLDSKPTSKHWNFMYGGGGAE